MDRSTYYIQTKTFISSRLVAVIDYFSLWLTSVPRLNITKVIFYSLKTY